MSFPYWKGLPPGTNPQLLSVSGDQLSITEGNTVTLPDTASTWYLYPALPIAPATGGAINFVDASGTHILESINGNLFYDTELLAKANDIQDVADWALYPALAAVNIDGQTVSNVESLELDTSGGAPVTLTTNAGAQVLANGVPLSTQADVSGAVGQWSTFPAVSAVDMSQNDISGCTGLTLTTVAPGQAVLTSNAGGQLLVNGSVISTGVSGDVTQWATFPAVSTVDMSFNDITRTGNITGKQIAITGDNAVDLTGPGRVNITGQNGLQGEVNITAQPGTFGQSVGGAVNITANGGVLGPLTFGGVINLDANTGSIGSYGAATSAIKMSAAGVNIYSGAISPIGSLAGYSFISSTLGTNICTGLPPLLPNIPLTTYLYGTGGIGLEAGIGAEVEVKNSDFATLAIKPRTSALVNFGDLVITGRPNIITPVQYVQLDMVKSLTFDPATAASISNVATINGSPYPPVSNTDQWATFNAVQNVDISGFSITNANNIGATGTVTAANLTATGGTLKLFDTAAPAFFGDTVYDSGTGRLVVLPQAVAPEFVAYLSDIPQVYQAQYYNSVDQNLTSGNTDLTFDSTQPWNNTGGYITHTNGTANFTVVQAGIYQLEFNTLILANGAVTTGNASVGFDITRTGPEIAVIRNTTGLIASAQNYAQAVAASYYLEAGDVINVRVANTFTLGPPAAAGVTGTFDYNTFFTWTYISAGGATSFQTPPPVIQAAGTTALVAGNVNTLYILTSGTVQNFTTAGLGAGNAGSVWTVKNAQASGGGGNDVNIQANGSPIAGATDVLHQRTNTTNTGPQTLYWSGTVLTMY
jgi:hypothetical protein